MEPLVDAPALCAENADDPECSVLRGACVYDWRRDSADSPDVARLRSAWGGPDASRLARDCRVVVPQPEEPHCIICESASTALEARIADANRAMDVESLPVISNPREDVVVALLDTLPAEPRVDLYSPHGAVLRRLLNRLTCPPGGGCIASVVPSLALPIVDGGRVDRERGGYYGRFSDVARAVVDASQRARQPDGRVILHLAFGWERAYGTGESSS